MSKYLDISKPDFTPVYLPEENLDRAILEVVNNSTSEKYLKLSNSNNFVPIYKDSLELSEKELKSKRVAQKLQTINYKEKELISHLNPLKKLMLKITKK